MRAIQLIISRIGLFVFQLIYPKIFFGEFSSFKDAERKSKMRSHYSSDQEILENYNQILTNLNMLKHLYITESKRYSVQRFNFLPTLLAGMNLKEIHILDIGSGWIGIGRTIELTVTNTHAKVTNYDLPVYSKISQLNPKNIPNLNFIEKIEDAKNVDLAYFGSSIQYFSDWQSILRAVAELNPRYIVISDSTFTNSKTFCTLQKNVSKRVIPRWIFQEEEMSTLMKQIGYRKKLETENFSPIWNLKGRNLKKQLFQKNLVYSQET
jgi:putative methyltransferase (TIGR04325 family)